MKLYLIHCGFYDPQVAEGIYESHVNYFVAAESFASARERAKLIPEFKAKRMHIDGLQEIAAVSGFAVTLNQSVELKDATIIKAEKHRELATRLNPT